RKTANRLTRTCRELQPMSAASGGGGGKAVVAQNFPASWVAAAALEVLPQKVQSLLQRLGPLEGPPVVSQGPNGLQALACFQNASDARAAVQTLHGFDMRSAAEKQAANNEAPKENECFSLRIADESGVAGSKTARKRKLKANGIFLWPLPQNWAEKDVELLASPYGTVLRTKVEGMANGQKGVLIDFLKPSAASAAQAALNGLSLMGATIRCVMQEEPQAAQPLMMYFSYLDELVKSPIAQEVEPKLDDKEIFVTHLPPKAGTEDGVRFLLGSFGDIEEVFLLRDAQQRPSGKAFVLFKSHSEARKALEAIRGSSADGASKAFWSESERALRGTRGAYGLNVLRHLQGQNGSKMQEIRKAAAAGSLQLEILDDTSNNGHVLFVASCGEAAQAEECWRLLSAALACVHETHAAEVRGSLVLRGFPASWSEKGLKFVFAPFGGLTSVTIEEEEENAQPICVSGEVAPSGRLAYVKLRNSQAMDKAVANLHQTKVGDGDLVEECIVACHRWHSKSWIDGSFQVSIFIDQLALSRRPLEAGPGPEDRELYVRNLPLHDMSRQQLQEYFEGFGEVDDLHLNADAFSMEQVNEGYIRFKDHRDAVRCIEALTPTDPDEADPTDLAGSWSESERVLQRKTNCYRFNVVAELVGADGSGLERIKAEARLKGLWILGESLQLKDKTAPKACGRQLHFVGRCTEEVNVRFFRDLLERELEVIHRKIASRLEKRKQKEVCEKEGQSAVNGQERMAGAWSQPPSFWGNPSPNTNNYDGYQAASAGAAWSRPPDAERSAEMERKGQTRRHKRKDKSEKDRGHSEGKEKHSHSRRRRRRKEEASNSASNH
ncbi:CUGBP Elav-like family member 4 (CELF-4) (Bruno-like protein 4) (CUG-BP- and ETR-3-like factor 4) (RNA-binding protein BRUNOL-4), partial [Durusdinium trenchii]